MKKHLGEFIRTYSAVVLALITVMVPMANAQVIGNGGAVVACVDSTLTCSGNYLVGLNLGNANTWTATQTFPNIINSGLSANDTCVGTNASKQLIDGSGCGGISPSVTNNFSAVQNFNGSSGTSSGAPTTTYGINLGEGNGTTNNVAVEIPWQLGTSGWSCASSCTVSDSAKLCFTNMGSGGPGTECMYRSQSTASIVIGTGVGTAITLTGAIAAGNNAITGLLKLGQNAAGDIMGSCTMSSSTSCTVTWSYTPTYCVAGDVGTTARYASVSISGTTETITANASNSDTWDLHCL